MTTAQTNCFTGWDIGGAHLKVARCDSQGELINAIQLPCPLWLGIDQLEQTIKQALSQLDNLADQHIITMTGELADIFTDRKSGVAAIIDCLTDQIGTEQLHVYAGKSGWLSVSEAKQQWHSVASMNWLASAELCARQQQDALFIDIGSTTSDIIPIWQHQVQPTGLTDYQRLQTGELVYSGVIRTALMALTDHAPFAGVQISLANELFATTADCWLLLEKLSANDIQDNSADGKPWTQANSERRLARMLGTDASEASSQQWRQLAQWFAEIQIQQITMACLRVLSKHEQMRDSAPLIGAGVGRFMVRECAQRLGRPYIDFEQLNGLSLPDAASYAPAAALALLAQQQFT